MKMACIAPRMQIDFIPVENDSPLQRLARISLGGREPVEWVREERQKDRTWQDIANDLASRIGTPVSRETVRLWAAETAEATS